MGMNNANVTPMKKGSTIFFQAMVVCIGVAALVLMLWEPQLEGRNVGATLFEIYFKDPFLAYAYLSSIAFFAALYKAFKVLGYVRNDNAFSQATADALQTIKRCAVASIVLVAGAVAYIVITMRGKDDIAGGVAMGLLMMFVSAVAAMVAGTLERAVRKRVAISQIS